MAGILGGCACGKVRYRLMDRPMIVHACHCSYCQRETGAAFAVNALIETDRVEFPGTAPACIVTPSASGKGQKIMRCAECQIALLSHYAGMGDALAFIRVGTLDNPALFPPDVHIFTETKQQWVIIPDGMERFAEFYGGKDIVRLYGEDNALRLRQARQT